MSITNDYNWKYLPVFICIEFDIRFHSCVFCVFFKLGLLCCLDTVWLADWAFKHKCHNSCLALKFMMKHTVHAGPSVYVSTIDGFILCFHFIMIFYFLLSDTPSPPLPFLLSAKQAVDLDKWVCLLTCLISCNVCPNQPGNCPRSCPVAHWMSYWMK